jgi:hypothetical protein
LALIKLALGGDVSDGGYAGLLMKGAEIVARRTRRR